MGYMYVLFNIMYTPTNIDADNLDKSGTQVNFF